MERRSPGRRLADRLRDELLTVMSHDLMTPLTTLDGHVQLLREDAESGRVEPAALANGLTVVERQVARLIEMAELVREYLRWEQRTQELVREPTDLGAVAGRIVETLQPAAPEHQIRLALPPAPVVGLWDARRLAQIVQNVVGNAIKYSPNGGAITVAVSAGPSAASLCVRDHGMGLPAGALPHLFERGYRAGDDAVERTAGPAGTTRRPEGSGLGLYLCQRIVEAHGGRIWAESAGTGKGSTFWVSLPYGDAPEAPTPRL